MIIIAIINKCLGFLFKAFRDCSKIMYKKKGQFNIKLWQSKWKCKKIVSWINLLEGKIRVIVRKLFKMFNFLTKILRKKAVERRKLVKITEKINVSLRIWTIKVSIAKLNNKRTKKEWQEYNRLVRKVHSWF